MFSRARSVVLLCLSLLLLVCLYLVLSCPCRLESPLEALCASLESQDVSSIVSARELLLRQLDMMNDTNGTITSAPDVPVAVPTAVVDALRWACSDFLPPAAGDGGTNVSSVVGSRECRGGEPTIRALLASTVTADATVSQLALCLGPRDFPSLPFKDDISFPVNSSSPGPIMQHMASEFQRATACVSSAALACISKLRANSADPMVPVDVLAVQATVVVAAFAGLVRLAIGPVRSAMHSLPPTRLGKHSRDLCALLASLCQHFHNLCSEGFLAPSQRVSSDGLGALTCCASLADRASTAVVSLLVPVVISAATLKFKAALSCVGDSDGSVVVRGHRFDTQPAPFGKRVSDPLNVQCPALIPRGALDASSVLYDFASVNMHGQSSECVPGVEKSPWYALLAEFPEKIRIELDSVVTDWIAASSLAIPYNPSQSGPSQSAFGPSESTAVESAALFVPVNLASRRSSSPDMPPGSGPYTAISAPNEELAWTIGSGGHANDTPPAVLPDEFTIPGSLPAATSHHRIMLPPLSPPGTATTFPVLPRPVMPRPRMGSHDAMATDATAFDRDDSPLLSSPTVSASSQVRLSVVNAITMLIHTTGRCEAALQCGEVSAFLISAWVSAVHSVVSSITLPTHLFILPDITQQQWKHFQPFYKGSKATHGINMWHLMLRGLVFDLQLMCGLARFKAPVPVAPYFSAAAVAPCVVTVSKSPLESFVRRYPTLLLSSALVTSLSPILAVYKQLHPSRVRMEQYRVDIGYLITYVLAILPHCFISQPESDTSVEVDEMITSLEGLLLVCGLMAGPPSFAIAVSQALEAGLAPEPQHHSLRTGLPPALSQFASVFGVATISPIQHARTMCGFNPLDWRGIASCCIGPECTVHDDFRTWLKFDWSLALLHQCGLSRQDIISAICKRHELFAWEYPALTPDETVTKRTLQAVDCVRQGLQALDAK